MKNQTGMVSSANVEPMEEVGCRIESGGFFGTVRFIGTLPDHPGKWYGIEWDDPTRGKHNGTVNGIQYFRTSHPTAGSFVRRERINFGKSLVDAIITKYGKEESSIVKKIHEQQIINLQKQIKAPFIEFVGFDKVSTKQSDFESLAIVGVRQTNISSIGAACDLRRLFPNIRELDISKNLLTSWQDVFTICTELNQLYNLNVSENKLVFPEKCEHVFPNITVFICGYMNLTWDDIKKLAEFFPNINELRANNNNITHLDTDKKNSFHNLEILDVEYNPIKNWDEVMKLNNIRTLQELCIGNIDLENIDFKTEDPKTNCFENLTKLCINNNLISDWKSVSELNRLRNLEDLKFLNNPVLNSEDSDTSIAMVVAKIGNLKVHNGRNLLGRFKTDDEFRRGCEYDYLKRYGLEWLRVKGTPEEASFLKEHNRYLELVQKYGELEFAELKTQDTSKLKYTLINLKLQFKDKIISKKVAPTMLVQKLKILTQKLFKLDVEPELVCYSENYYEIPLDDETKELSFFNVKDNDDIFVKI